MPNQDKSFDLDKLESVVDAAIRFSAQPWSTSNFRKAFDTTTAKKLIELLRVAHGDVDLVLHLRDNAENKCHQLKARVAELEQGDETLTQLLSERDHNLCDLETKTTQVEALRLAVFEIRKVVMRLPKELLLTLDLTAAQDALWEAMQLCLDDAPDSAEPPK